jgi:hypothetical protein
MGLSFDETGKTEVPCHSRCGTRKIPPCSKALSAEHRPKFCSLSPVMVTFTHKWKILERDVKPYINQSIICWTVVFILALTMGNPILLSWLWAHGRCDLSAEDVYSSKAPDLTAGVTYQQRMFTPPWHLILGVTYQQRVFTPPWHLILGVTYQQRMFTPPWQVWLISRGCLLLHGTWTYHFFCLLYIQGPPWLSG